MPSRRSVLASIGSLATAATAGCLDVSSDIDPGTSTDTDWPMPDFDSRATSWARDAAAPERPQKNASESTSRVRPIAPSSPTGPSFSRQWAV